MHSTAQDRLDSINRVGSHSTKGTGRGTVWWIPKDIPRGMTELEQAAYSAGVKAFWKLLSIHKHALEGGRDQRDFRMKIEAKMHLLMKNLMRARKSARSTNSHEPAIQVQTARPSERGQHVIARNARG